MSPTPDVHSRSVLAGYRPTTLFDATALVVGVGALGQNLSLNLALLGWGRMWVVDFDRFEAHNATRSPLFPTAAERARLGVGKAAVGARKLRALMTAPNPVVAYADAPIQAIGDLLIASADVVFSAVDSAAGRAFLADRARLHGRPLVEGGFHGPELNLAVFGPDPDEPCYRCAAPGRVGAFSCSRYAAAAAHDVVPAIQNGAAVLGGYQAEAGVLWLHGQAPLRSRRLYAHVRTGTTSVVNLARERTCPGVHWRPAEPPEEVPVAPQAPLGDLLAAVEQSVGPAELRLPEPLVLRAACTGCGALVEPLSPEWRWLISPRCRACGGAFDPAPAGQFPAGLEQIPTSGLEPTVLALTCADVGIPAGCAFEVHPLRGGRRLLRLAGTVDDLLTPVGESGG